MRRRVDNTGFTFIELVLVVSILGILSAIAIPQYNAYQRRVYLRDGYLNSHQLRLNIEEYYAYFGTFPKDIAALTQSDPEDFATLHIDNIRVENGAVHVEFGDDVPYGLGGKVISFLPELSNSSSKKMLGWCAGCDETKREKNVTYIGIDRTTIKQP